MNNHIYLQFISLNKKHTEHYLRRYVKLASFYKERNLKKKKFLHHEHHIIPKAFGGPDTNENLIYITPREHFILHHLLYKAFPKSSMTTAFFGMCNGFRHYCDNKITSKVYEKLQIEKAERQSEIQKKKVEDGKHHGLGPETNLKRVAEGRHNFQKRPDGSSLASDRVVEGKHHWQDKEKSREAAKKRVADGKNHLSGGELQRKMFENGTHPSQIKKLCPHCNKEFDLMNFSNHHGDRCKLNPLFKEEPKIVCEHCNKQFYIRNYKQHHGDKCKLNPLFVDERKPEPKTIWVCNSSIKKLIQKDLLEEYLSNGFVLGMKFKVI